MKRFAFAIVAGVMATACFGGGDDDVEFDAPVDGPSDGGVDAPGYYGTVPAFLNRNLDVIVVVDNSGSMLAEQQQLTANFPAFINVLQQVAGGLPDLHLGVISSDVGAAGQLGVPGCESNGDDGNMLAGPSGSTCATQFGLQGTFISDIARQDGTRLRNYNGELAQLFTCMASLGTSGCGFEQHLEAMFRSLQPGKNPGFFRDEAHLAMIFLADEDDCSTELGTMFGDPNAGLMSQLGPRTSFRCFEFGVECDNDPDPRAFGPRTGCRPRASSQFMFEVERYTAFLQNLKNTDGQARTVVAGILGNFDATTGEVVVGPDPNNPMFPSVQKSCFTRDPNDPDDGATPPVRLQAFLDAFPSSVQTTVCNENLQDALVQIGETIKDAIGNPCIDAAILDTGPDQPGLQPACTVRDVVGDASSTIPACNPAFQPVNSDCNPGGVATPCWCFLSDPQQCPSTPNNLSIQIARGGGIPPLGTVTEIYCQTEE